jgi:hypothetical protein
MMMHSSSMAQMLGVIEESFGRREWLCLGGLRGLSLCVTLACCLQSPRRRRSLCSISSTTLFKQE